MSLTAKRFQYTSRSILVCLILFEIAIVFIYLGSILQTGTPYPPFDMNGQMTVSSNLQALHLFLIGLSALFLLIVLPRSSAPPSRKFMWTIAILLIYGAIDEIFKIHLKLHHFLPLQHRDWFGIYFGICIALPVFFYRDFIALWKNYRQETVLAMMGMLIFMLGGFGADLLNQFVLQPLLSTLSDPSNRMTLFVGSAKIAFEEFAELLGENFVLYGVLLFVAKKLKIYNEPSSFDF